jgi:hypothetical protein
MNSSQFIRDKDKVYAALHVTDNNEMVAKKSLKVYIPARFIQSEMAKFESENTFVGICAFVVDDKYYAVSCVTAVMRTEPTAINDVIIDDVEYVEMAYDPGSRVIANVNLVKIDNLIYKIYDEFISKGRVPWYMGYEDLGKLLENSHYYSGVKVGNNPQILEMIAATICRSPSDVKKYYRQGIESKEENVTNPPVVIPLRAVSYGATNAIAKLMGPYFDENVTSTLVSPGQRVERVERLLRT